MGKILNAFVQEKLRLEPFDDFDSAETINAREYAGRLEDGFSKTLDADQRALFEALTDAQAREDYLYSVDRVIFGYRLGALMTMEVFTDMNRLFTGREGK